MAQNLYHLVLSHHRLPHRKHTRGPSLFFQWKEGHMLPVLFFFQVEEELLNLGSHLIIINPHFQFPTSTLPKLGHCSMLCNSSQPHQIEMNKVLLNFYNKQTMLFKINQKMILLTMHVLVCQPWWLVVHQGSHDGKLSRAFSLQQQYLGRLLIC